MILNNALGKYVVMDGLRYLDADASQSNDHLNEILRTFNPSLFSEPITKIMCLDESLEHIPQSLPPLLDPETLVFIEPALLNCIEQVTPTSLDLDSRVISFIPLCKRIALQCHDTILTKSTKVDASLTPLTRSIWRSGELLQLLSKVGVERSLALITVISRLEWVISYLVDRRLYLKDNLLSNCVREILGPGLVLVLQCLFGCVKGFNLKNLTWHGFLSSSNVPKEICSLLYCTICSVNSRLTTKSFKKRPSSPILDIPNLTQCPDLSTRTCQTIIKNSSLIHPEQRALWLAFIELSTPLLLRSQTLDLSLNKKLSSLNLVLLQHCLRRLWVVTSGSDIGRCSAQNTEFYITLDEMFSPEIPLNVPRPGASYFSSVYTKSKSNEEENVLLASLGSGTFHALLDLLIHGEGLRMRDKLSHCECADVSTATSRHLLYLSLAILARFCDDDVKSMNIEVISHFDLYQHRFHPLNLILDSLSSIDRSVGKLSGLVKEMENLDLEPKKLDFVEELESLLINTSVISEPSMKLFIGQAKTKYYSLLLQILRNTNSYSTELVEVCQNKSELFRQRKLRSRQRQNFFNLLGSLPVFMRSLAASRVLIYHAVFHIESLESAEFEENKEFVKLLKSSLKCFENLVTYVGQCKWNEIGKFLIVHHKNWISAINSGLLLKE